MSGLGSDPRQGKRDGVTAREQDPIVGSSARGLNPLIFVAAFGVLAVALFLFLNGRRTAQSQSLVTPAETQTAAAMPPPPLDIAPPAAPVPRGGSRCSPAGGGQQRLPHRRRPTIRHNGCTPRAWLSICSPVTPPRFRSPQHYPPAPLLLSASPWPENRLAAILLKPRLPAQRQCQLLLVRALLY